MKKMMIAVLALMLALAPAALAEPEGDGFRDIYQIFDGTGGPVIPTGADAPLGLPGNPDVVPGKETGLWLTDPLAKQIVFEDPEDAPGRMAEVFGDTAFYIVYDRDADLALGLDPQLDPEDVAIYTSADGVLRSAIELPDGRFSSPVDAVAETGFVCSVAVMFDKVSQQPLGSAVFVADEANAEALMQSLEKRGYASGYSVIDYTLPADYEFNRPHWRITLKESAMPSGGGKKGGSSGGDDGGYHVGGYTY